MNDTKNEQRPDDDRGQAFPPAQLDHVVDPVMVRMRERRQTKIRRLINFGVAAFGIFVTVLIGTAGSNADRRLEQVVDGLSDVVDGLSRVVREMEGTRRSEELRENPKPILTGADGVLSQDQPLSQSVPQDDIARIQLSLGGAGRYRVDVTAPDVNGDQPDPMAALYRETDDQRFEQVVFDDDGGDSLNSSLVFNATDDENRSYFVDIWEFYGDAATFNIQLTQLTETQ